ncbi:MAG: aminotransferase class V-fold PLP-dependent enzyme [Proteobacteria bacterium]|nr:aminotransferase class V-fold PLP-dependent enzyme [Pseudomonadota bacterium]
MPARRPIYLDHQATTPVDPRVLDAMLPFFREDFGNAASRSHVFGWRAEAAVEEARETVAAVIGARPNEVVFTSGATESNNLAIKGAARALRPDRTHLITVATEHHAVLDPVRRLEGEGFQVTVLGVDPDGLVDPTELAAAITERTALVSVMAANNEIGVLQPLAEIGRVCRERGVWLHTDAAQAVGKIPVAVDELGVDLLSISGHKVYGPKGVGALFVRGRRPRVRLEPLFDGGGHERSLRSGTLPVPLIVGLGRARAISVETMDEECARLAELRERLWKRLSSELGGVRINGHPEKRLAGNLNVSFEGVDGDRLLLALKDVAVSSGSACTSALPEPSHVLGALRVPPALARASLRFGIGRSNTAEEIDRAAARVVEEVRSQRAAGAPAR